MFCSVPALKRGLVKGITAYRHFSISGSLNNIMESSIRLKEARTHRLAVFDEEMQKQLSYVTRIQKIAVNVEHPAEVGKATEGRELPKNQRDFDRPLELGNVLASPLVTTKMMMNRGLSTPYNCAMHLGELMMQRSALALVDGSPWDMHRPLESDCKLSFLHFKEDNPFLVNMAFWRSCSYVLGYIMETAFKEEFFVDLCGFPPPQVSSMSFVYDANLNFRGKEWKPTSTELNSLSRIGSRLGYQDNRFYRLDVSSKVAKEMFKYNSYKSDQVARIASQSSSGDAVTVYKMDDHVDISRGPMIGSTKFFGRYTVTALHDVEHPQYGPMKRMQGLAIPSQLQLHGWTYNYLCQQAAKLNKTMFQVPVTSLPVNDATTAAAASGSQ